MRVICNNCGLKWVRFTEDDNPGGTVPYTEIQYYCPKCGSEKTLLKHLEELDKEEGNPKVKVQLSVALAGINPDTTSGILLASGKFSTPYVLVDVCMEEDCGTIYATEIGRVMSELRVQIQQQQGRMNPPFGIGKG